MKRSTRYFLIFLSLLCLSSCQTKPDTTQASGNFDFSPNLSLTKNAQGMQGKIAFVEERGQPNFRIAQLNLNTQDITTLFQIPEGGWVYQLDASAKNSSLVMSYSAPSKEAYDRSGIYILEDGAAEPYLVTGASEAFVYYLDPVFSAEGDYIYYVISDRSTASLKLERLHLASGQIEFIAEGALWPKLSTDGKSLIYLSINQDTGLRSLIKANPDGSEAITLIEENNLADLDLPFFSEDSKWVYVSVPEEQSTVLLSVLGLAYAHGNHNLPSNWWRIPITGGEAEQITHEAVLHYYGETSNSTMAFTGSKGLYISKHSNDTLILKSRALRVFTWLP